MKSKELEIFHFTRVYKVDLFELKLQKNVHKILTVWDTLVDVSWTIQIQFIDFINVYYLKM